MNTGGAAPAAGRYLTGLSVGALSLCAAGWLGLMPLAFGYQRTGRVALTSFGTSAGLALVAVVMLVCWSAAWRRKLRADGVLRARPARAAGPGRARAGRERRRARRHARAERLVAASRHTRELPVAPDPAQVLTDLRALLNPLLAGAPESAAVTEGVRVVSAADRAAARGPAAAERVPAGVSQTAARAPAATVVAPAHDRVPQRAGTTAFLATDPGSLLRGAELLMVGCGEEETW